MTINEALAKNVLNEALVRNDGKFALRVCELLLNHLEKSERNEIAGSFWEDRYMGECLFPNCVSNTSRPT